MPPSTILSSVRQPLATALAGVAGNVYAYVPESVIPPAVVVVPDTPFLEPLPVPPAPPPPVPPTPLVPEP